MTNPCMVQINKRGGANVVSGDMGVGDRVYLFTVATNYIAVSLSSEVPFDTN